jgi:pSer/pThr/pTyr-binding forkhead associated (FHA) protein
MYIVVNDKNSATIGRYVSNGVIFQEPTVSRFHAEIFIREDKKTGEKEFAVRDLHSKFGTLLYEEGMEVKLTNRDRAIQINKTVFVFRIRVRQKMMAALKQMSQLETA